jgi:hypothetical protein
MKLKQISLKQMRFVRVSVVVFEDAVVVQMVPDIKELVVVKLVLVWAVGVLVLDQVIVLMIVIVIVNVNVQEIMEVKIKVDLQVLPLQDLNECLTEIVVDY